MKRNLRRFESAIVPTRVGPQGSIISACAIERRQPRKPSPSNPFVSRRLHVSDARCFGVGGGCFDVADQPVLCSRWWCSFRHGQPPGKRWRSGSAEPIACSGYARASHFQPPWVDCPSAEQSSVDPPVRRHGHPGGTARLPRADCAPPQSGRCPLQGSSPDPTGDAAICDDDSLASPRRRNGNAPGIAWHACRGAVVAQTKADGVGHDVQRHRLLCFLPKEPPKNRQGSLPI